MSSRRHFLRTGLAAAFVPGSGLRAQAPRVPARAITHAPPFHGFARNDKRRFCPQNHLVCGNQVGSPTDEDGIRFGLVDLEDGDRFCLFKARTCGVAVISKDKMDRNGQSTDLPGTDNARGLNDGYSPAFRAGEWRCNTHPRSIHDGRFICIDSPHQGGRQMCLIDGRDIVG